jgi:phosphoglycerate dehydrogenase-like enzyme
MPRPAPLGSVLVFNGAADLYAQAIRARFPALQVLATADRAVALDVLRTADALVVSAPWVDDALLQAGARLRWIHALSSGTDTIMGSAKLPPQTVVSSSRGVHGPQMAELALLLMMALARDLPAMLRNQAGGAWVRWSQPLLWRRRVAILGSGHVARELGLRCKAMGMRVDAVSANPAPQDAFDEVHPRARVLEVVAEADFVVVLTALDDCTRHWVGAATFAAMRPSAFLVNLSRGGVVDERALVDAIESRRIAGAGLDVFETEPLPAGHSLRRLPGVIVTPHIGGQSDIYVDQVLPVLLNNIEAVLAGRPASLANRLR